MWTDLTAKYNRSGIVLALGAGVSFGSGLPGWAELLDRIAEEMKVPIPVKRLRELGMSLPTIATLLRDSEDPVEFAGRVRRALYRDFPFFPEGWKHRREEFVRHIDVRNPTLSAVGQFCSGPVASEVGQMGNPRIPAVVTFNLDSLLQEYVAARYGRKFLRTIERASASTRLHKIPLYHAHGHIRFDQEWRDRTRSAPDALVLGELEYFDVFDNPTGVFTYSLLHLMRTHSLLFVGLSMSDDNLRRLLHYSRRELCASYRAEGVKPETRDLDRHFAILKLEKRSEETEYRERSLQSLGVNALWVNEYSEVPARLRELYESGGDSWECSEPAGVPLVALYGLPGSGKSTLLESYRAKRFSVFDDFMRNSKGNRAKIQYSRHFEGIISALRESRPCAISDIRLCEREYRKSVLDALREQIPEVSIEWVCFDCSTPDAIEICRDNVRYRAETTSRNCEHALEWIDRLARKYTVARRAQVHPVVHARRLNGH